MTRKTISLDADVYRLLRSRMERKESLSAALRRLLTPELDPLDYEEELMADPPKVDIALLRRRQANPPRSNRSRHRAA